MNAYAFALALAGAFTVATVFTDDIKNPVFLYLQFSVVMLIVGHLVFKVKLNPMFDQAVEAVKAKQKSEPVDGGNV